jgi:hypothetical protein
VRVQHEHPRKWLESHVAPLLIRVLGMRGLAKLIVSRVAGELGEDRVG